MVTEVKEKILPSGCGEDSGWDYFEDDVRSEFEFYACRTGYDITKDSSGIFYKHSKTEDAWRMFHRGHVDGRSFKC